MPVPRKYIDELRAIVARHVADARRDALHADLVGSEAYRKHASFRETVDRLFGPNPIGGKR